MGHRLFKILTLLSLLLFVLTFLMWVRSYWAGDMLVHREIRLFEQMETGIDRRVLSSRGHMVLEKAEWSRGVVRDRQHPRDVPIPEVALEMRVVCAQASR